MKYSIWNYLQQFFIAYSKPTKSLETGLRKNQDTAILNCWQIFGSIEKVPENQIWGNSFLVNNWVYNIEF